MTGVIVVFLIALLLGLTDKSENQKIREIEQGEYESTEEYRIKDYEGYLQRVKKAGFINPRDLENKLEGQFTLYILLPCTVLFIVGVCYLIYEVLKLTGVL